MPKPEFKTNRRKVSYLMNRANARVAKCRVAFASVYSAAESEGRWTPEQEQELQDAVDALEAAEADITAALTEARNDLMSCVDSGPGDP